MPVLMIGEVIEVCETEADGKNWFDTNVTPDWQHFPLHIAITK